MVETSFNLFDAVVLSVVFLSTLLSFFRGFVRELLSLGSWIGAMAVTVIYTPDLANNIKDNIDKGDAAAMLVASISLFFGAKILFSLLNLLLMKYLKPGKDVGIVDNFMGLMFGFIRAALLLSLGYYVYSFVASEENQPDWITHSFTKPYVASGASMLEPYLQDFVERVAPAVQEQAEQIQPEASQQLETIENISSEDFQRLMQELQNQKQQESGMQ